MQAIASKTAIGIHETGHEAAVETSQSLTVLTILILESSLSIIPLVRELIMKMFVLFGMAPLQPVQFRRTVFVEEESNFFHQSINEQCTFSCDLC